MGFHNKGKDLEYYKGTSYVHCESYEFILMVGVVSLFNGISTFVGYLMPNLFSLKNSSGTI